jgi:WD40 repeat protein
MSATPKAVPCLATLAGSSNSVAFHPTARLLATGSDDRTVKLWRLSPENSSAFCVATLTGHSEPVTSVAFDPTGTLLASGSEDNTAKLWRLSPRNSSATCVATLTEHTDGVNSVAFDPTGTLLATGSDDNTAKLWRLSSMTCVATLEGHEGHRNWVNSVAFDPTGTLLATGSQDKTAKLWRLLPDNLEAITCVDTLRGGGWVYSVAFDPTGTLLATCTPAKLWQLSPDNSSAMTLEGHSMWVTCVAFHPTARLLATGSEDSTVKLWRLSADGATCVATLKAGRGEVTSLGFDPTGTVLATGNVDGTKLWDCRQFQRKNVTDDFREISSVLATRLVGNSVKGHSSMKSAITHRVALGKGERWLGIDPYMAARVSEHLKQLYRMRSANGSVVVPFNFPGVQHMNMMKLLKNKPEDDDKRSGGSKWTRARSRSKSKSKMMNINRTTLKRKPPKQH